MSEPTFTARFRPYVCQVKLDGTIVVQPTWPLSHGGPALENVEELAAQLERWLNATGEER